MNKPEAPQLQEYRIVQQEISQHRNKLQEITKNKEYWFEKKESLKKEIKDLITNIKELRIEMGKKANEVKDLKANRKKYNSEVKILVDRIRNLHEEKEKAFKELLESIKQMKAIMAGKRKPSRVFVIEYDKATKTYKRWRKDFPIGKLVRVKDFLPPPAKLIIPRKRKRPAGKR